MTGSPDVVEWDVVHDTLAAFGPLIRLRAGKGWKLDSWNIYRVQQGGGRIAPYTEEYVCAVFKRDRKEEREK